MLESLRNAAKGWIAKTLIFFLAASFGVWGIADVFTGYRSGALATVGNEEVSAEEFNIAFNRAVQQMGAQTGQNLTPDEARKLGIDRGILNNLAQSAAIDNQAKALKLSVGDAQIVKDTQANKAFQDANGKFDAAQFQRVLEANGLNEQMYLATERQNRLRRAVTDSVDSNLTAPPSLVKAFYQHRNEQRDARYFVVKIADSEIPAPTDTEIKKQYEANPGLYTAPEYRSIAVMKAEPADVAAKVTLTPEDVTAGYEKYKADYFTPEKRTVLQITFPSVDEAQKAKDKIAAGTEFLAIAKERGFADADVTFADKTKADFFDPVIAEAAFKLGENLVSDPVKGSLATSLLKVIKITPENQKTLDEVKGELEQRLKLGRAREEIQSVYDSVEDARAAQEKFEAIAARVGIPFQLITHVDARGAGVDAKDLLVPGKPEILTAAFGSDVGVENDAVSVNDGYIWYEVREVVPSAVKPLDKVMDQVKADIAASKMQAALVEKAKKLVERANGGATFESLALEATATIMTARGLKRGEGTETFNPGALQALFAVPANGYAYALEGDGKSAKVMQAQAVLLPPFDEKSEDAKAIATSLQRGASDDVLAAYLGALQASTGVTINETLWRQISGTQTQ